MFEVHVQPGPRSLQAFLQQLMQQMANPARLAEARRALTSILTGLLLILHTMLFGHSHSISGFLRCGSVVADTRDGQRLMVVSGFGAISHSDTCGLAQCGMCGQQCRRSPLAAHRSAVISRKS